MIGASTLASTVCQTDGWSRRRGPVGRGCLVVLFRSAYLGVTNALAMLRLLSMSDRAKDAEILALRHQITALERQLPEDSFTPADRALLAALLHRLLRTVLGQVPPAGASGNRAALAPEPDHRPSRAYLPPETCRPAAHAPIHPRPGAPPRAREQLLGVRAHPPGTTRSGRQGSRVHGLGDPPRRRHRPGARPDITRLGSVPTLPARRSGEHRLHVDAGCPSGEADRVVPPR
jgi:hypothetical protein